MALHRIPRTDLETVLRDIVRSGEHIDSLTLDGDHWVVVTVDRIETRPAGETAHLSSLTAAARLGAHRHAAAADDPAPGKEPQRREAVARGPAVRGQPRVEFRRGGTRGFHAVVAAGN